MAPPELPELERSEQQDAAFDMIVAWFERSQKERVAPLRISGYAGTGKTTLLARRVVPFFQERNVNFTVNTFTGKAASVLAHKGVPNPGTIHSLIYRAFVDDQGQDRWARRKSIAADLIVIDEASMVTAAMKADIESYGVPVLYVGDGFQMPPVGEDCGFMGNADYQLTEIHRQAASSPIIRLSVDIRRGVKRFPRGTWGDDTRGWLTISDSVFDPLAHDMMICARNATRHRLNAFKRLHLGRRDLIEGDDLLICLRNDRHSTLRNGTIVRVLDVHDISETRARATLRDEVSGEVFHERTILTSCFGQQADHEELRSTEDLPMDYGYALTCHKALGSQASKVGVLQEFLYGVDPQRWLYTACTRAEHQLFLLLGLTH